MRVLLEFPFSDEIKASLFAWNGKFILKLEYGLFEQTYKISETDISNAAEIKSYCAKPEFQESVARVFSLMAASWSPD